MFSSRTNWPLAPNRLSEEFEERRRRGLPVLDLTESNPTRCGFVYEAREILRALAHPQSLNYEPDPRGPLAARRAVAGYYAERGTEPTPEQIFLTTSTSEAYSYIFRLLADPGDNILVPRPSYPLFDFLGRLDDVELIPYRLVYDDGWQIDLESVEGRLNPRTRAVLVVDPNNPTGSFVRRQEFRFLLDRCAKRHLALVSDEVFADYAFAPAGLEVGDFVRRGAKPEALTFMLSGLSKISALPQMKLAWLVVDGPAEVLSGALARLELIADTYLSVSGPLAHALPELLEMRRSLQGQILERVRSNLLWLDQQLSRESPLSRLKAEGGWYAILKLPSSRSDEDWAVELLRQDGVLVHPGHFYDFPSEGHLVLSLLPQAEIFKQAMARILARLLQKS
jgi:aspartate/methionine/tyrosine aminotransferase